MLQESLLMVCLLGHPCLQNMNYSVLLLGISIFSQVVLAHWQEMTAYTNSSILMSSLYLSSLISVTGTHESAPVVHRNFL